MVDVMPESCDVQNVVIMFTLMPQGEMHCACSLVAQSFHTTWNVSPELQLALAAE